MMLELYFITIVTLGIPYIVLDNYVSYRTAHDPELPFALLPAEQLRCIRAYREVLEKRGEHPWFMFFVKNIGEISAFYGLVWIVFIILSLFR